MINEDNEYKIFIQIVSLMIPGDPLKGVPDAGSIMVDSHFRATPEYESLLLNRELEKLLEAFKIPIDSPDINFDAKSLFDLANEYKHAWRSWAKAVGEPLIIRYYSHPRVLVSLGIDPSPPAHQGRVMAPLDSKLLEPVMRRKPFFRKVTSD